MIWYSAYVDLCDIILIRLNVTKILVGAYMCAMYVYVVNVQ